MLFEHNCTRPESEKYYFAENTVAAGHSSLCNKTVKMLFHSFAFRSAAIDIAEDDRLHFAIGEASELPVDGESYSINITGSGISVNAQTKENLFYGFYTLLDLIRMDSHGRVYADCRQITEKPLLKIRMIHFCIFPETELWELTKIIRLAAVLKYSHLILEFWGMYKYDCNDALSWSHAFTKSDLEEPLREARELGLEIVPMFNHWGHASQSRQKHGKHVVLDSHPEMQPYFSDSGWCWNYKNPKVRKLLSDIRRELTDLCGEGKFFHIGGDEAEEFSFYPEETDVLCDYINETARDIEGHSRIPIMWGDMLLTQEDYCGSDNEYSANCPDKASQSHITSRLSRSILIADWQYSVKTAPVETSLYLSKLGFRVLVCPWDRSMAAQNACLKTAMDNNLYGVIHTTWHTLSGGMPYVGTLRHPAGGALCPKAAEAWISGLLQFKERCFMQTVISKNQVGQKTK